MPRKGVSFDDKRIRIKKILVDGKQPFTLRQLESLGKKAGVVSQSVKEVAQSLVDDHLAKLEKVGTQNLYWSFATERAQNLRAKRRKLEHTIAEHARAQENVENEITVLEETRKPSEKRKATIQQLDHLRAHKAELEAKLGAHRLNDPALLEKLQQLGDIAREATERWTDNIFSLQSYCKKKWNMSNHEFYKSMGLGNDFDYMEDK